MMTGDLVIYRTLRYGACPAVFVAYVGRNRAKALIRIGGVERRVYLSCVEAL